ncbi:MAG: hypothetical protein MUC91_10675, partial [Verrucomicrobia bacterium]|nr:hypothetical protein [Verrucomicrobiota bacterium]
MKPDMNRTRSFQTGAWLAVALGLNLANTTLLAAGGVYVESPDFSNKSGTPTAISPVLQLGTNTISGSVDSSQWGLDHDYFRVTIPADSRISGIRLKVTNYSAEQGSFGLMEVLPSQSGNTGGANIPGNMNLDLGFAIGAPTNIVFHLAAPFIFDFGMTASFSYQIELLVTPLEIVAGTSICTAVEVVFPTQTNSFYQLQCTSDLQTGTWSNVGQPVPGN